MQAINQALNLACANRKLKTEKITIHRQCDNKRAQHTRSNVWKNVDVNASGEPRASRNSGIAKALTPNDLAHVQSNVGNQMRCCSNELLGNVTHEPDRFLSLM